MENALYKNLPFPSLLTADCCLELSTATAGFWLLSEAGWYCCCAKHSEHVVTWCRTAYLYSGYTGSCVYKKQAFPNELTICSVFQKSSKSVRHLRQFGDRAFCIVAPHLWNHLPRNMRTCDSLYPFKRLLKTYLFKIAFYS